MRIDLLTLFPEACEPFLSASIVGRARSSGVVSIRCVNIRDHTTDPHRKVDDKPFGGGPGMVMMCQPVFDAVAAVGGDDENVTTVLLTPQGERLNQSIVSQLATSRHPVLIAGHYEGFDERIRTGLAPREISIGDYVLSGGESAALVLIDAVVRLLPGALGDEASAAEDSFSMADAARLADENDRRPDKTERFEADGLLEYPQYTRPRVYRDLSVPEVLLSGDHEKIRRWRAEQSVARTRARRPDLLPDPTRQDLDDAP